jgi:hypothetical protein
VGTLTTMRVETARDAELAGFLGLAAEVEQWFGPMVDDPGFRTAVCKHIRRGTALVAIAPERPEPVGGLLFGASRRSTTYVGSLSPNRHVGEAWAAP